MATVSKSSSRLGRAELRDRGVIYARGSKFFFGDTAESLSARLRRDTREAHQAVERAARLPTRLETRADYIGCLVQFHALVPPLEREFLKFSGWRGVGIDLSRRRRAPALHADLAALGVVPPGATGAVPRLPDFATALGALYVLEGATLGGAVILRALSETLERDIGGATAFFAGHGAQAGPMWQAFRTALDRFGAREPAAHEAVIAGAQKIFASFEAGLRA